MKILFSHRTRSRDGQHVHIRGLTNALSHLGHDLTIAGPGGEKHVASSLGGREQHRFRPLVSSAAYEIAELGYCFPAYLRMLRLAKVSSPEILYERYNLYFHAGVWLKKKLGIPLILEVNAPLAEERATHGGLTLNSFARNSERSIWRAADIVLPVSNVLADYLRLQGVTDEKINVIHNGVGKNFLVPRNRSNIREKYNLQDKLVLGFTGFMRDWHRVDLAVQFLAMHPNDDVCLMIIGDGPARHSLEKLAEVLGVSNRVVFTGVVQCNALPDYIDAFDVALQPAVVEYASPLKLFEYMALGKAILAPDSSNIREVLTHGSDAILFDGSIRDDFDKSLLALIGDHELRERLGAAARANLSRQNLTWEGNAQRVTELAMCLLEEKK